MTSTTTMTLADLKAQEKAAKKAEKERQKRIDADEKAERKRAEDEQAAVGAHPACAAALEIDAARAQRVARTGRAARAGGTLPRAARAVIGALGGDAAPRTLAVGARRA